MQKSPEYQELQKVNMPAYQSITEAMVAERVASLTQELQQLEQAMDKDKDDPLLQIKHLIYKENLQSIWMLKRER